MRPKVEVLNDWKSATLNPGTDVFQVTRTLNEDSRRYLMVGQTFGIPSWVIGAIHYRESSFDFTSWLANGDPLMRHGRPAATTHVPKGLGPAPDWESAAVLSLANMKWHAGMDWDIASALIHLEAYNGMGYYQHHGIRSPYIWSGTNHYHMGKYSSDGHYDPGLVDKQMGCAAIALALKAQGFDVFE